MTCCKNGFLFGIRPAILVKTQLSLSASTFRNGMNFDTH